MLTYKQDMKIFDCQHSDWLAGINTRNALFYGLSSPIQEDFAMQNLTCTDAFNTTDIQGNSNSRTFTYIEFELELC